MQHLRLYSLHFNDLWGIYIKKENPNAERPYRFGYPFVPALYIIVTTAICITLLVYDTLNTGLGLGIVAWEYRVLFSNG
jgi:APA family basic amino acid/polyamine antiporter